MVKSIRTIFCKLLVYQGKCLNFKVIFLLCQILCLIKETVWQETDIKQRIDLIWPNLWDITDKLVFYQLTMGVQFWIKINNFQMSNLSWGTLKIVQPNSILINSMFSLKRGKRRRKRQDLSRLNILLCLLLFHLFAEHSEIEDQLFYMICFISC